MADDDFLRVLTIDADSHWPAPMTMAPVCELKSEAVLLVFQRDRVTCEGCAAWLAKHPFVTNWEGASA